MATTIRPELSEKNPYWIEKHRYYELKHFCLQYPIWRKAYASLDGFNSKPADWAMFIATNTLGDPTAKVGIARAYYSERTDMIERLLTVPLSPMETMRTASPFLSCSGFNAGALGLSFAATESLLFLSSMLLRSF